MSEIWNERVVIGFFHGVFEPLIGGVCTKTGSQIRGVGDFMRIELDKEIIDVRYLKKINQSYQD